MRSATCLLLAAIACGRTPLLGGEPAPLDLAALLGEAEASAPSVRAAAARLAAAASLPERAGALPDPTVSLALTNERLDAWTVGESPMSNVTVTWTQEIPYRGKRRAATEAARAEGAVAQAEMSRVRAELRARVKAAYVDLLRIERLRAILDENRLLLVTMREAARARFETGGAPLEGALGAGAEIARLDAEIAALDGERHETEAEMTALLGRRVAAPFGPATRVPVEIPFDPDDLIASAAAGSARAGTLRAAARREEARLAALELDLKPDFSWSAGYAWRSSLDPMAMGLFGVRLPLFKDRKQALAVAEGEHALEGARREADEAELDATATVRRALARIESARTRIALLAGAAVPQGRAALDAALAAYTSGRADFGTVLGYAEDLLRDARAIEDLRSERLRALALLEPAVGRELLLAAPADPPPLVTDGGLHD